MSEVELFGETFTVAEEVSDFALMEFADAASDGEALGRMHGLAALYRVLRELVDEKDFPRFRRAAIREKADVEALIDVIGVVMRAGRAVEQSTGRPTGRPSVSSDGPAATAANSTAGSFSPVIVRLEQQGRPDLAQIVGMAQAAG